MWNSVYSIHNVKTDFKYMVWESARKMALGFPPPLLFLVSSDSHCFLEGFYLAVVLDWWPQDVPAKGAPGSTGSWSCPVLPQWGAPSAGCPKQDAWESSSERAWPPSALEGSLSWSTCAGRQHCLSCATVIYPKSQARQAVRPTGATDVKLSFRIIETGNASPWEFRKEKQLV